jgi:hypothetical protein
MTEKEKMLKQMLHDANDLKSYQMIWLGQRIFVMTTTNFAHLMKKESKTDEKVAGRSQRSIVMRFVKGKLHQYFFEIICFRNSRDIFYSPLHNGIKYRQQILPFQC